MNYRQNFFLLFFFLILLFSCSAKKSKETIQEVTKIKDSLKSIHVKESIKDNIDCIFDQKTQNDDFLKGIEELKEYSWDAISKTATIKFSNKEILEIYRGGCNHFSLNATFKVSKNITFKNNREFIFSKISWVSNLIFNKTESKIISDCLNSSYSVDNTNPNDIHINLMNNKVYNNFTIFYNSKNTEYNSFSIDYYQE